MSHLMLVRLRPYNPAIGNVSKDKSISGVKFHEGEWVPLSMSKPGNSELCEYLKTETQEVAYGPLAFDVCTVAEAKAVRKMERMAKFATPRQKEAKKPKPPPKAEASSDDLGLNDPEPTHVLDLPAEIRKDEDEWAEEMKAAEEKAKADAIEAAKSKLAKKKTAKKKATKRTSKRSGRAG